MVPRCNQDAHAGAGRIHLLLGVVFYQLLCDLQPGSNAIIRSGALLNRTTDIIRFPIRQTQVRIFAGGPP